MKKIINLCAIILLALVFGCGQQNGRSTDDSKSSKQKDSAAWAQQVRDQYRVLAYYYNNNIHDSLEMKLPEVLDFCREHELWSDYYDTWMMLGEEYSFSGEYSKAIKVVQEIHDDATKRGNKYGLTASEFIKGLVYDGQGNYKESASSFEAALSNYPANGAPFQKNSIYVYYLTELKNLHNADKMRSTLAEWRAYIEECRKDTTLKPIQFHNWLYYYHHSCYLYYIHQKDFDKAALQVDSVVLHLEKTGWSQVTRNEVMGYRARLAIERKNYAEALKLNDQQLPLAKELDVNAYVEILGQRAQILSGLGKWKDAYSFLDQFHTLVDSLREGETLLQLNELNKRYELDEIKAQQEREKMESERRQMILVMAIVVIVLLAFVVFVIFRLQAARRLAKLKTEQERIESELRIAREIQMSMVPHEFPHLDGLDMYASMAPAREVGGDLYGYVMADEQLYFCLGDVSGKGVPASLFMNGMFVTCFVGLIDLKSGHLSFCNAGHNPPVIGGSSSKGDFLEMESNAPLGLWPGLEYVGEEIDTIKGRPLFIYSDGLTEAENDQQQQFGNELLLSILRNTQFESSKQVIDTLAAEVEKHRNGAEPNDDLSMMCIRV